MGDLLSNATASGRKVSTMYDFLEAVAGYFLNEHQIKKHPTRKKITKEKLIKKSKKLYYSFFPKDYLVSDESKYKKLVDDLEAGNKQLWAYFLGWIIHYEDSDVRFQKIKACSPFSEKEVWIVHHDMRGVHLPKIFPNNSKRKLIREYFEEKELSSGVYLVAMQEEERLTEEDVCLGVSFENKFSR